MDYWVWAVLLMVAGLCFVGLEMFIPSGGLLGVLAGVSFIASIVCAFFDGWRTGLGMIIVDSLVIPGLIAIGIHYWPSTPLGRAVLGNRPEHPDDVLPDTEEYRSYRKLIGRIGQTTSKMLPSGTVSIDGRTYEALSDGVAIEKSQIIQVVEIRMNRLVVTSYNGPKESVIDDQPPPSCAAPSSAHSPFDEIGLDETLS